MDQTRPWNNWQWNDGTVWAGDIERGKELRREWEAKKAQDAQMRLKQNMQKSER